MTAALTFDPAQVLVLVLLALAFVLLAIWGVAEAQRDRVARHEQRQLLRELQGHGDDRT